jgi:hypothetical protein
VGLSRRHKKIFNDIMRRPTKKNIKWADVKTLINAVGGEYSYSKNNRVRIKIPGPNNQVEKGVFPIPHKKELDVYVVDRLRNLLITAEVDQLFDGE